MLKEAKSDQKFVSGIVMPPKVNKFFPMKLADYFCSNPADIHTNKQTDKPDRLHNLSNFRGGGNKYSNRGQTLYFMQYSKLKFCRKKISKNVINRWPLLIRIRRYVFVLLLWREFFVIFVQYRLVSSVHFWFLLLHPASLCLWCESFLLKVDQEMFAAILLWNIHTAQSNYHNAPHRVWVRVYPSPLKAHIMVNAHYFTITWMLNIKILEDLHWLHW